MVLVYEKMTVAQLKERLVKRRRRTTGTKAELIERLRGKKTAAKKTAAKRRSSSKRSSYIRASAAMSSAKRSASKRRSSSKRRSAIKKMTLSQLYSDLGVASIRRISGHKHKSLARLPKRKRSVAKISRRVKRVANKKRKGSLARLSSSKKSGWSIR